MVYWLNGLVVRGGTFCFSKCLSRLLRRCIEMELWSCVL